MEVIVKTHEFVTL